MKKILGFIEEITTCDCCGKSGLKGTLAVDIDGAILYYGSTCAVTKHGVNKAEASKEISKAEKIIKTVNRWIMVHKLDPSLKSQMVNHLTLKNGSLRDFL